ARAQAGPERQAEENQPDRDPNHEGPGIGERRQGHEGERDEGRIDERVEPAPHRGSRELVLDALLEVEIVEPGALALRDQAAGGASLSGITTRLPTARPRAGRRAMPPSRSGDRR